MQTVININDRGTLTLPKAFRTHLGVSNAGQIVVEETEDGVLLRPGVALPGRLYSKEKVDKLAQADADLAPYAEAMRAALKRARKK